MGVNFPMMAAHCSPYGPALRLPLARIGSHRQIEKAAPAGRRAMRSITFARTVSWGNVLSRLLRSAFSIRKPPDRPLGIVHLFAWARKYNAEIMAVHCGTTEVALQKKMWSDTLEQGCFRKSAVIAVLLCDAHAEHCDLCNQTFCATCLAFHHREQHQKKPAAVDKRRKHWRSA